jgi:hypothetical protein
MIVIIMVSCLRAELENFIGGLRQMIKSRSSKNIRLKLVVGQQIGGAAGPAGISAFNLNVSYHRDGRQFGILRAGR